MKLTDIPRRLSVNRKIGLLLGLMVVIAGVNVAVVFHFQSQVAKDSNAVNVAGQQRMLTQRMTRFANAVANGDMEARDPLRAAMEKYQSNLDALDTGGTTGGIQVPAVPDSARAQLRAERDGWQPFKENVRTVLTADPDSDEFRAAHAEIKADSDSLLTTSDDLVTALSAANTQQISFMQTVLLGLFAVDILVFVAGLVVARRYVSTPLARLDRVAAEIADGDLQTDVMGTSRQFIDGDDEIASLARTLNTMQSNLRDRIETAQEAREQAESAQAEAQESRAQAEEAQAQAEALASSLETQARQVSDVVARAADGDLTARLDTDRDHEAMAQIATEFNDLLATLEEAIVEIQTFGETVGTASQEVVAGASEVQEASDQVAESVSEIAGGAATQTDNLEEVSGELNDLSATVEEIASSSDEVAELSQAAAEQAREGSDLAASSKEVLDRIETRADETVAEMEQLESEVGKIHEIVELIEEIAEQTNILALNASIEAARAGEAGDGFAVVASEVKSLAEETQEATQDVSQVVERVQDSTTASVTDMREMRETIETGMTTIDEGLTALDRIADTVAEANDGVQSINEATDQQADSTQEIVAMVDDVASVSEQTSDEAETVSAAAEEQATTVTQIAENAQDLEASVADLSDRLAAFTVGETVDTTTAVEQGGGDRTATQPEGPAGTERGATSPDPARANGGKTTDGSGGDRGHEEFTGGDLGDLATESHEVTTEDGVGQSVDDGAGSPFADSPGDGATSTRADE